ncbi:MAG: hypothetical protein A2725_01530 [Candidatus Magasanikbacteria bacterium RIFCSPHIGHO2_01_FULL_33_34]|uniref:HD domain-containing protein n=1 Tax=Candidatus Magasanikbacteria bacterium RIFCSPHIGHO2_01_FULL_33_34 TaxID=1798671 RepID=A0A1F6LJI4_9BACT|nr:MAG: hypothetical protein A2725_01530 [Candidatus Magasanikbacteria bacterium RIFCSPHIGHO2_01_FULL_33_34]OGH65494.1 MAG: hypothetical protein A3B83_01285 [Candidatus Magasanikbacteria bacterium RIFCSPHIGHO2_02_FULL_33_17]OGH76204.1 MAG: hypothetical protein A3A89_02105 [Candidatus Magasanikbacteria bacterium RIFCSPLOWO2_01_FULL_33_34]OGH82610.1 MAG: hypothetical protein A3F93_04840 [Candidatus Magasanikbacteria bacterium RIFCSPLOWO2_12_FULL_34_7]
MEKEKFQPNPIQNLLMKVMSEMRNNPGLFQEMKQAKRSEKFYSEPLEQKDETKRSKDTVGLTHAINTHNITKELTDIDLKNNKLDETQSFRLRITALIHDMGELSPKGDIDYNEKSSTDTKEEIEYFEKNIQNLFPNLLKTEIENILEIYKENIHYKDKGENTQEAKYFNMVEFVGALMHALEEFDEKRDNMKWRRFCDDYLYNIAEKIENIINNYPAAKQYLSNHKNKLQKMINWAEKEIKENPKHKEMEKLTDEKIITWKNILKKIS